MKLQSICPYCDCEDFELERKMIICEQCGEILDISELHVKKLEEN